MRLGQRHVCLCCSYSSQAHTYIHHWKPVGWTLLCRRAVTLDPNAFHAGRPKGPLSALPALQFSHQIEGPPQLFPHQDLALLTQFYHVPVALHSSNRDAGRSWGRAGARGWAGSSWLPELALRLPLLIFPPSSASGVQPQPMPNLIPHKLVPGKANGAGFCKVALTEGTVSARAGGRRRMGSSSQGDQGRTAKIQALGLTANAVP